MRSLIMGHRRSSSAGSPKSAGGDGTSHNNSNTNSPSLSLSTKEGLGKLFSSMRRRTSYDSPPPVLPMDQDNHAGTIYGTRYHEWCHYSNSTTSSPGLIWPSSSKNNTPVFNETPKLSLSGLVSSTRLESVSEHSSLLSPTDSVKQAAFLVHATSNEIRYNQDPSCIEDIGNAAVARSEIPASVVTPRKDFKLQSPQKRKGFIPNEKNEVIVDQQIFALESILSQTQLSDSASIGSPSSPDSASLSFSSGGEAQEFNSSTLAAETPQDKVLSQQDGGLQIDMAPKLEKDYFNSRPPAQYSYNFGGAHSQQDQDYEFGGDDDIEGNGYCDEDDDFFDESLLDEINQVPTDFDMAGQLAPPRAAFAQQHNKCPVMTPISERSVEDSPIQHSFISSGIFPVDKTSSPSVLSMLSPIDTSNFSTSLATSTSAPPLSQSSNFDKFDEIVAYTRHDNGWMLERRRKQGNAMQVVGWEQIPDGAI